VSKLFVLGDSFSYPHAGNANLWPIVAARKLEKLSNKKIEVVNNSLIGASQDFTWNTLDSILTEITQEDFLIIVLTSPDRFWYFQNRPEYSNIQNIQNIKEISDNPKIQESLLTFVTNIWRDSLALQLQNHRLGYLAYQVVSKKLRTPLILFGFHNLVNPDQYPELLFSKNSLSKIQIEEFEKSSINRPREDILLDKKYWHHVDCRYNHLCLSNHQVLGELAAESLVNNTRVDLESTLFYKKIITEQNCKDKEFANKELNPSFFKEMESNRVRQQLGAPSFKLRF